MLNTTIWLLLPTFFFISITPGLCMTLALTLGLTLGIRKTLWMMVGELVGLALVAVTSATGIAAIIFKYPELFIIFKIIGGVYLLWLGIRMLLNRTNSIEIKLDKVKPVANFQLISQGFVTVIINPKSWTFLVSIIPTFIDYTKSVTIQLSIIVSLILVVEFICMLIYAFGGKSLKYFLKKQDNVKILNKISGSLIVIIAFVLILS